MSKFYLATSSLNFENILSMQKIFPQVKYGDNTLWWNRFEQVLNTQDEWITLYDVCPVFRIEETDGRANYPMVVVLDKKVQGFDLAFQKEVIVSLCSGKEKVVCTYGVRSPIEITQDDFLSGKVKFLFLSQGELKETVHRYEANANKIWIDHSLMKVMSKAECKKCFLLDQYIVLRFEAEIGDVSRTCSQEAEDKKQMAMERLRGSELGYEVSSSVSFLKGIFPLAYRCKSKHAQMDYDTWRKNLPEPFGLVLKRVLDRTTFLWEEGRSSIVQFVTDLWYTSFVGKRYQGEVIEEHSYIHRSLQRLALSFAKPDMVYIVGKESDLYVRTLYVFLECGASYEKYQKYLMYGYDVELKYDYLLALYGALVGYLHFAPPLLDVGFYLERLNNDSLICESYSQFITNTNVHEEITKVASQYPKFRKQIEDAYHEMLKRYKDKKMVRDSDGIDYLLSSLKQRLNYSSGSRGMVQGDLFSQGSSANDVEECIRDLQGRLKQLCNCVRAVNRGDA